MLEELSEDLPGECSGLYLAFLRSIEERETKRHRLP